MWCGDGGVNKSLTLVIKFSFLCFYYLPGKRGSMKEGLERLHRGGNFQSEFWRNERGISRTGEEKTGGGIFTRLTQTSASYDAERPSLMESQIHGDLDSGMSRDVMVDKPGLCSQGVWTGILDLLPDDCVTWRKWVGFLICKWIPVITPQKDRCGLLQCPKNVMSALWMWAVMTVSLLPITAWLEKIPKPSGLWLSSGLSQIMLHENNLWPSSNGKDSACNVGPRYDSWVRKIPWRRERQPTPVFLQGESHGQRRVAGYSPWGCRIGQNCVINKENSIK